MAAALSRGEPRLVIGVGIYVAGLLAMLGCSLLYRATTETRRRQFFRRIDHAAIFAMIAGSATPFALARAGAYGITLAAALWAVAALGIVFKLRFPIGSIRRSALLYLLLGWASLVAVGPRISTETALLIAVAALSTPSASLFCCGGGCATASRSGTLLCSPALPATAWRSSTASFCIIGGTSLSGIGLPSCATTRHNRQLAPPRKEWTMKEGYRFVDCDMHIMEPADLFDKYLDPAFKPRITSAMRPVDGGSTGMRRRPLWFFDGTPTSNDGNVSQYNRIRGPLVGARGNKNVMFAVERGYDAEAQIIGMEMEGIDIAVLFPTAGLSFLARDDMDPQFSNAICRA